MLLVDILLACNLVVLLACALRPAIRRPGPLELLGRAGLSVVPAPRGLPAHTGAVIVPLRTRAERELQAARALHPSSS